MRMVKPPCTDSRRGPFLFLFAPVPPGRKSGVVKKFSWSIIVVISVILFIVGLRPPRGDSALTCL